MKKIDFFWNSKIFKVFDEGYIRAIYFLKVLMSLYNNANAYIHSTALKKIKLV
jgi:hypothetical protein